MSCGQIALNNLGLKVEKYLQVLISQMNVKIIITKNKNDK